MDEYTGKRVVGRFGFSRSGSTLSFRDPNQEDGSVKYCSRLGCSSRLNSMKGIQANNQEKLNSSKAPLRSTNSNVIAGSSSRSSSCSSDFRKTPQRPHNRIFLRETGIAESSSRQGELEDVRYCNRLELVEDSDSSSRQGETDDSEFGSVASNTQTVPPDSSEELESAILLGIAMNTAEPLSSGTAISSSRPRKQLNRRLESSKQDTSGSSVRRSSVYRNITGSTKPVSQGMGAGAPRYGLKNLGCTSISDVLSSGCSSSESGHGRRFSSIRKRPCDGGSSSTGVRGVSGSSTGGHSGSPVRGLSGLLPESSSSQQTSRRVRNQPTNRDGAVSVRTRRPSGGETRMRLPEQEVDNIVTSSETIVIPQLTQNQFSFPESVQESSSRSSPAKQTPVFRNTYGRLGTNGRSARTRSSSRLEDRRTQIFRGPTEDRDSYRRFNMESIAEVLLALERIEQDEELTYEQLMVLETNLFLGGLSFHDQHRDMRMDIDNMSYEELLDLEEKMGTVSTALSEEALAKCIKRSIYATATVLPGITCSGDDDIKCSICQEEYVVRDELGKLACEHRFHLPCIHQWLRQKNRCPICKASS